MAKTKAPVDGVAAPKVRVEPLGSPGVFADLFRVVVTDERVMLAFAQVQYVDKEKGEAFGQEAALLYLTRKTAQDLLKSLNEALSDDGNGADAP